MRSKTHDKTIACASRKRLDISGDTLRLLDSLANELRVSRGEVIRMSLVNLYETKALVRDCTAMLQRVESAMDENRQAMGLIADFIAETLRREGHYQDDQHLPDS